MKRSGAAHRYRRHSLRTLIVCVLAMGASGICVRGVARAQPAAPSLAFVTRSGHSLAVRGKGWGHHVVVTARIGASTNGIVLTAGTGGSFTVALDYTVACGGVSVEARDYRGRDLSIKHAGPLCPNRPGEPAPTLSVLQGSHGTPRVHVLKGPSSPRALTLHVGNVLRITEPGGMTPSITPSADTQHFALLANGLLPSGDQFWQWIAVKRGEGTVALSPACRQTRPPCERSEAVVDITIVK